jgi:hypothetical protein
MPMRESAQAAGKRLITFAIEADVAFETPADIERFANELADRIAELAAKYDSPRARRRFRVIAGGHPAPKPQETADGPHAQAAEQKPFVVEVSIDAPPDAVWRALSDPAEIRRWFGWDASTLDEEIRYIFVDHATAVPPARLEMEGMHTIHIVPDGSRTTVRVVCASGLADAKWDDIYDGLEEGWRTFFHQLRYYLERRAGQDRRTLYLAGTAAAPAVLAALDAAAPGEEWQRSRHQRAVVPAAGADLVSLVSRQPLQSAEPAKVAVTVSAYGLDDEAFSALRQDWESRWAALVPDGKVTV